MMNQMVELPPGIEDVWGWYTWMIVAAVAFIVLGNIAALVLDARLRRARGKLVRALERREHQRVAERFLQTGLAEFRAKAPLEGLAASYGVQMHEKLASQPSPHMIRMEDFDPATRTVVCRRCGVRFSAQVLAATRAVALGSQENASVGQCLGRTT
jgi:hypothetical protein